MPTDVLSMPTDVLSTRVVGPSSRAPGAQRVGTVTRETAELVACPDCGATTTAEIVAADAHGRHLARVPGGRASYRSHEGTPWTTVNCAGRVCL